MNTIEIVESVFSPWKAIEDFQATHLAGKADFGATASFIGTMRDFNEDDDVSSMVLEHYPGMTELQLESLVEKAYSQWPLLHTLIIHRVGEINPGEPIVLVAVWSAHRAAAFDGSRFLMEQLKSTAPFWKKEALTDGSERWVEKNTKG